MDGFAWESHRQGKLHIRKKRETTNSSLKDSLIYISRRRRRFSYTQPRFQPLPTLYDDDSLTHLFCSYNITSLIFFFFFTIMTTHEWSA